MAKAKDTNLDAIELGLSAQIEVQVLGGTCSQEVELIGVGMDDVHHSALSVENHLNLDYCLAYEFFTWSDGEGREIPIELISDELHLLGGGAPHVQFSSPGKMPFHHPAGQGGQRTMQGQGRRAGVRQVVPGWRRLGWRGVVCVRRLTAGVRVGMIGLADGSAGRSRAALPPEESPRSTEHGAG